MAQAERKSNPAYAHDKWVYESGKRAQHDMWLTLLSGEPPKQEG